jgi:hypothetical protein
MTNYKIGCDAHRRYSQFAILDHEGHFLQQVRVNHMPGAMENIALGSRGEETRELS